MFQNTTHMIQKCCMDDYNPYETQNMNIYNHLYLSYMSLFCLKM